MNEIDILMDELLKDVEVNVAEEPRVMPAFKRVENSKIILRKLFCAGSSPNKTGQPGPEY